MTKCPQMFAIFTSKAGDNFTVLARGSKMLVEFFDQDTCMSYYDNLC